MKERFEGVENRRLLIEVLAQQKIVAGDCNLAERIADIGNLLELQKGDVLIEQEAEDNAIYLILAGSLRIIVNAKQVGIRRYGNHVGEMAAIEPSQRRSANVVADETSVVIQLTEPQLAEIALQYPTIWRVFAAELSRRLYERNQFVNAPRKKVRLFVISSKEALPIAEAIKAAFQDDTFETKLWVEDTFRACSYTLEDLERELDEADFAVAVAHADDETTSRGKDWPAPRDNVIFELGLFMGRLGRKRAILMEPRGEGIKLPSDLAGVTTITYLPQMRSGLIFSWWRKQDEVSVRMAGACEKLRQHIYRQGMRD